MRTLTILFNTPFWYCCYSIQDATHASAPPNLPTLAHHHAGTSPQCTTHVTHASTSPTLARHPRYHATNANTPATLARLPCKHATHDTQRQHKQLAISQTHGYPMKLLKLLALKFQEEIQQFLLTVFSFTTFTFQTFFNIFI